MPKNFFKAIGVMVGYIIGVGMFGLPYLISESGLFIFFILIVGLGLTQYFVHLIYANVILVTENYHRLPGYAGKYLGKNSKRIAVVAKLIGNYGALLAYIIITGIFLNELLSPFFGGSEFLYATLLFALEAAVVFFGIGMLARAELIMSCLLLLMVGLISIKGWGDISAANYSLVDWHKMLLPYGAVLFAIDGNGSLPIVSKLLKRDKKRIKQVIRIGTLIPVIVIIIFTLVIVGISGPNTTPDALAGIQGSVGNTMIFFALIFGIITMVTSFLGVSESIREMLMWDYKLNKYLAWALAVFVPFTLYLAGMKSLIAVISFVGAVAGGASAIILILIFLKLEKLKDKLVLFKRKPGEVIISVLITIFVCGIIYEVFNFIIR
ncbi:hypothetical protein DRH27_05775 [Candidatus Falkowbacteria bacterium]|nr:MAG: hypothetical protein DRH27_05775 [Candidatus Falkowbacteria bacterium]